MKLIVGLGNPGKEYEGTRHNIGFEAISLLSEFYHIPLDHTKMQGIYGMGLCHGEKVILLEPQKYMNLSGEVIASFLHYFKIEAQDLLVIHDDLDLDVGKYRLRAQGSSGGHNGLKNIELHLGTKQYYRLKIGISKNKLYDTKDYVLGKFTKEEQKQLHSVLEQVPSIVDAYLTKPFSEVMNLYNKK